MNRDDQWHRSDLDNRLLQLDAERQADAENVLDKQIADGLKSGTLKQLPVATAKIGKAYQDITDTIGNPNLTEEQKKPVIAALQRQIRDYNRMVMPVQTDQRMPTIGEHFEKQTFIDPDTGQRLQRVTSRTGTKLEPIYKAGGKAGGQGEEKPITPQQYVSDQSHLTAMRESMAKSEAAKLTASGWEADHSSPEHPRGTVRDHWWEPPHPIKTTPQEIEAEAYRRVDEHLKPIKEQLESSFRRQGQQSTQQSAGQSAGQSAQADPQQQPDKIGENQYQQALSILQNWKAGKLNGDDPKVIQAELIFRAYRNQ